MGLETGNFISDLINTNPLSTDKRRFGDDHLRLIKKVLLNTLPNADGAINPSVTEFNTLVGIDSDIQDQLDLKLESASLDDFVRLDVQNAYTKGQASVQEEIIFATTINADAELSNAFFMTVTNNFLWNTPVNGISGQVLTIFFVQDGTGDRVITYGTGFFGTPGDDLRLSTASGKVDLMTLIYAAPNWYVASLKKDMLNAL